MLALGRKLPVKGRRNPFALEDIRHLVTRKKAAAIDPGAEIGGYGHIRRGGDDAAGECAVAAGDFIEQQSETGLGRYGGLLRRGERLGHRDGCRRVAAAALAVERRRGDEVVQHGRRYRQSFEGVPFMTFAHAE